MTDQLPVIILAAPLLGAILVGLFGYRNHGTCYTIAVTALSVSMVSAASCAWKVFSSGPINYFLGGWDAGKIVNGVEIPLGFGIQLRVDYLNALVVVVIGIVVLFVSLFAIRRQGSQDTEKTHYFFTLFLMLCTGLFGMAVTADAFNLFVLVEVSSLASYGLVAMGTSRRGTVAAFNYIIMGTVGASFYLLGVGYLYLKTGTLNMDGIRAIIHMPNEVGQAIYHSPSLLVAFILIMIGLWIKMAFFPLYGWLPNAYSYCPSSTSCVLAPLMTKVSVYVMIRMMVSVFGLNWIFEHFYNDFVVWLAVIAILAGSIFALAQKEIKKMLCYLIVAEVGYMVGGAWLADKNGWGITGSVYHILADAIMTFCLFLGVAILSKRARVVRLADLDGLFKKMPLTMAGFVIGGLSMIGVPPTCGFFSKFYLIRGGISSGQWEFVIALLLSSLINAILFFRIFEIAFFGRNPTESHGHDAKDHPENSPRLEAPLTSLIPLGFAAALILVVGLMNGPIVEFIRKTSGLLPLTATFNE